MKTVSSWSLRVLAPWRLDENQPQGLQDAKAPAPIGSDPSHVLQKSETRDLLAQSINTLPKRERLVVSLYYYEGLTMKEIARILDLNESRASQLHSAAMLRLRSRLKKVHKYVN